MTRSMAHGPRTVYADRPADVPSTASPGVACGLLAASLLLFAGCRSDMSQQLLERELRMQEDQIYQLQDELYDKCARLDRVAGENTSLRRQLGVTDGDAAPRGGRGPAPLLRGGPAGGDQPMIVPPPPIIPPPPLPGGLRTAPPAAVPPAPAVGPPTLEGVPPLPAEPRFPGAAMPGESGVAPAAATADSSPPPPLALPAPTGVEPAARPIDPATAPSAGRRLSHEESLAEAGRISHIVINPSRTECFDADADGATEGLAIVVEPRDADERLVTAAGDMSLAVFDVTPSAAGGPVARWDIPAAEAAAHFRRTSRNRGLHFVLRWPGPPPQGRHVRVHVSLATFEGGAYQADATVAARRDESPPAAAQ